MSEIPEIVPVGTLPPVGVVPKKMHAQVIRPERFGDPEKAFQLEQIDVPEIKPDEVLVACNGSGG
jgi:crotonyl-CoA carboxylase/reductase